MYMYQLTRRNMTIMSHEHVLKNNKNEKNEKEIQREW